MKMRRAVQFTRSSCLDLILIGSMAPPIGQINLLNSNHQKITLLNRTFTHSQPTPPFQDLYTRIDPISPLFGLFFFTHLRSQSNPPCDNLTPPPASLRRGVHTSPHDAQTPHTKLFHPPINRHSSTAMVVSHRNSSHASDPKSQIRTTHPRILVTPHPTSSPPLCASLCWGLIV